MAAALMFLEYHGIDTTADWRTLHEAMIAIANREMTKTELAELFRDLF